MVTSCVRVATCRLNVVKARQWNYRMNKRVGIYAGAFDPVHSGHIGFALQALNAGRLDEVYFVPERAPRGKDGITHYAHRIGMLRQALRPYPKLKVLDLPDRQFSVGSTLPRLTKRFPHAQLSFVMGSDVIESLPRWPKVAQLLEQCELVIGVRAGVSKLELLETLEALLIFPPMVTLIDSKQPHLSSGAIRRALRLNLPVHGLLTSVFRYARTQWLYVSVSSD